MGPRDWLRSPAFLLYCFFILLSILQLDARLCLFTGLVAAVEYFNFASLMIGMLTPESQIEFWRTPGFSFQPLAHPLLLYDPRDSKIYAALNLGHFGGRQQMALEIGGKTYPWHSGIHPRIELSEINQRD
jgi:hypothetical protein